MSHASTTAGTRRRAIFRAWDNATSSTKAWLVSWRPRTIRCCPTNPMSQGDGPEPPVWWDQIGDLRGRIAQCGGCGSLHEMRFRATRLPAE